MSTASDVVNNTSAYITAAQSTANNAISNLNLVASGWTSTSWSSIAKPTTGQYTLFTAETDAQIAAALSTLESAVTAGYGNFTESDAAIATALATLESAIAGGYTNFSDTAIISAISALESSIAGGYAPFTESDAAIATALATLESAITGGYTPFAESDSAIATALAAYDATLGGISPAALPSAPAVDGYTTPIWNDTFWTNLKSLLTTFTSNITSGDDVDTVVTKLTGETTKLQVALYAADRERKQQALRDAHSAANSAVGARGFTYPNSMTTALKLAAQQQYTFDLSQASRDLVKQIFEWAKSNYQFTVERQISAHSADVDFNIRYADILVRVYSEKVRSILEEYRNKVAGEISKAEQKIKEYTLRLDVTRVNAAIHESDDRIKLAKLEGKIKEYAQRLEVVRVNAAIDESDDRIKLAKLEAKLKEYAQQLEVVRVNAAIDESDDRIKLAKLEGKIKEYAQRLEVVRVNAAIDESDDRIKLGKLEARLKEYAQRLEVIRTNASVSSELDRVNSSNFSTEVQQHATDVAKAVETAASNARNKIDAAVAAVNAAANMVASASQISIGVLNG